MAQGLKKIVKSTTTKRNNALGPKRGHRVIAPRKTTLVKQKTLQKKLSAGLTGKTERNLAEKAGHLELLAGGKREKKEAEKAKKIKTDNGRKAIST